MKTEERLWEGAHRRLPEDAVIRMKLARVWVHDQPAESLALLHGVEPGPRRPLRAL